MLAFRSSTFALISGAILFLSSCEEKKTSSGISQVNPAFSEYLSAFSGGILSKVDNIQIKLTGTPSPTPIPGSEVTAGLFDIEPNVRGKAVWIDEQTIEFQPENPLKSGTEYQVIFKLGQLIDVPEDLNSFEYIFKTINPDFEVSIDGLESVSENELEKQKLIGSVSTSDFTEPEIVKQLVSVDFEGNNLPLTWEHTNNNQKHFFTAQNVIRQKDITKVKVTWTGSPLSVKNEGSQEVEVPALGDFRFITARIVQFPDQYISITFSDPLQGNQNLNGLIRLDNRTSMKYIIEGNKVKVYPSVRQAGTQTLSVEQGIKNSLGYAMNETQRMSLLFEQQKPDVRMAGSGTILPLSDGLVMPFETVNLRAVDVRVIRIYQNNVSQFLQVNDIGGESELKRVGNPVFQKTIKLNTSGITNIGHWNRFTLDLSGIINAQPGAIYQVQMGFKQQHSSYVCGNATGDEDLESIIEEQSWDSYQEDEQSYWDYYDEYYYDNYDWQERDNPCHSSYYGRRRSKSRNILASNLGMIAKLGNNGEMIVAVTDLITTEPIPNADVEFYDYQQQSLGVTATDNDGMVKVDLKDKPFMAIASYQNQKGYLKLDDGSSLSLSNFDVSGQKISKGFKGFIYGERGVWRPGDSLHLAFVLEDKTKILPNTHPVIFELKNPDGQLKRRIVRSSSINGFYNFGTNTDIDDVTGNWQASVKVGGAQFTKQVKIETVKPNRLKINLDFGKDKLTKEDNTVDGKLKVTWLHGAIARNLKAEFEVYMNVANTTFSRFPDYEFDDPSREFYGDRQTIFSGNIDSNGEAIIAHSLSTGSASPGMLTARFSGKVYEEGGNFSVDNFTLPFYPYSSFVGIKTPKGDASKGMLLTDVDHTVEVVNVDVEGNSNGRRTLEMEVYKLNWRWWWDRSYESVTNYVGNSSHRVVSKKTINTTDGHGEFKFQINYPDWGRYYVRVCDSESNHCTGKIVYIDWPGWAGRAQKDNPGGAAMLSFATDKSNYSVGEEVQVTIPGSENGRALISIESGSKVIQINWLETKQGENVYSFKTSPEMAPNVYINVTLVQPHAQTVNDLPIRLYGVFPISVKDQGTVLNPEIWMPDVLEPETEVKIGVSEKNDKPMAYTLALVDEGLLDLTRFKTPNPHNQFYAREALGVKTWDLYEDVMGSIGGNLERLISIGGGYDEEESKTTKANRFKPVVKFLGPFYLDPGETKEHTFTMPQYVGSVRTMIVAGDNGAYGNAEKATPVRQSVMVLGTLPRVLGPEEQVSLPVTVFAMDEKVKDVTVSIETNNLLTINGGKQKKIRFNQTGDQVVYFDLTTKPELGIATVKIVASSGGTSTTHDIELDVRNANPPVVNVVEKIIEKGQNWSGKYTVPGMIGTNSGILEVSSIPPIDLGRRLKYLTRYPHGCIEQTVSSAFPQLYLSDIMELDETLQLRIEDNVKAAIKRIETFQSNDGGFSYWPGSGDSHHWGTTYAGHFLIEAEKKGYLVPGNLVRKWKRFQRNAASGWRKSDYRYDDLVQAYRLFTLALAGDAQSAAMNRMREMSGINLQAQWRLAAAYAQAGQKQAAIQMVNGLSFDVAEYRELSGTFGSSMRDKAMILEALILLEQREKGADLLKEISARLSDNSRWMSTQTTAYALIAVSKFAGGSSDGTMNFDFKIDNNNQQTAATSAAVAQKPFEISGTNGGTVIVENKSEGVLFARIITEGTPVAGNETAAQSDLNISISYSNKEGKSLNPSNLEQGTNFMAEVTISNPGLRGDYEEMALSQIFPSGWEIINTRLDGTDDYYQKDQPKHTDIRDDRVYTYFDLRSNEKKTFIVLLNASYAGRYYLPAVNAEAMYDFSINARNRGQWVTVRKGQGI